MQQEQGAEKKREPGLSGTQSCALSVLCVLRQCAKVTATMTGLATAMIMPT